MRNKLLQIVAMVLAISALICFLPGCSSEKTKAVMELDGVTIGADIYRYWLSTFKYYFDTNYEDIEDTVECWNREMDDGLTIGEYVEEYTLQYAKSVLCALKLYKQYKLKLPDSVIDSIGDQLDELIKYQYGDSKSAFNSALMSTYGIDVKGLRRAFIMEAKVDMVESYLYGTGGKEAPTDSERDAFFKANYIRVNVIMINTSYELVLNDEGMPIYDENKQPIIKEYNEQEIAEKKAKADEAQKKAENGEDFSALVKEYTELNIDDRPNGFYICNKDYEDLVMSGYDSKSLSAVLDLKEGGVYRHEDEESVVIVKRLALLEKAYSSKDDKDQFDTLDTHLITEKYNTLLSSMWDDIEIDEYVYTLKTVNVKKGFI
ncbi:MAG: hypothetical protein J6M12_04545 [Clostridia bacterium]|nr:hypothetical protein [Clostridia bacterium]